MPDIFDSLDSPETSSKTDIFDEIEKAPSRTRSLISAPIKGAVKGAHELAGMVDPFKALLGLNEPTPFQRQAIEHFLPTQDNLLEKGLERAGKLSVAAIGGPESLAVKGLRTGAGAVLGQAAEEAGAPDWVQNLAELSAFLSPKFGKKLLPKPSQTEAVEYLRGKGLTDKEIAPLIKGEKQMKRLARYAEKNEKSKELVSGISEKLGEGYDTLKSKYSSLKQPALRGDAAVKFDDSLEKVLEKINPRFERLIKPDLEALRNKGITGENLINFYQDINAAVKGQEGGKAILGKLKGPILQGLDQLSPELSKDFRKLNEFYAKKAILAKGLKPGFFEDIMSKGKYYGAIGSVATGKLGFIKGLIGKEIGGRVANQLLSNPRLQNLSNQILQSMKDNKIPQAVKYYEVFKDVLRKDDEEAADALDSIKQDLR